jgi:hypothetical protein
MLLNFSVGIPVWEDTLCANANKYFECVHFFSFQIVIHIHALVCACAPVAAAVCVCAVCVCECVCVCVCVCVFARAPVIIVRTSQQILP